MFQDRHLKLPTRITKIQRKMSCEEKAQYLAKHIIPKLSVKARAHLFDLVINATQKPTGAER